MKVTRILISLSLILLCPPTLFADGTYYIGKDKKGLYMETDRNGSWYIGKEDVKHFKAGQKGRYATGRDETGIYISIDRHGKFYVDLDTREDDLKRAEAYNWEQERQAENSETAVVIKGKQVLVPVLLGHGRNTAEAFFLLDTGATNTVLHREVADELGIKGNPKGMLVTAGGKILQSDVAKLTYIRAGPVERRNIYAHIIEHQGPSAEFRGLLGMDFLWGLEYRIDFRRKVIEWKP